VIVNQVAISAHDRRRSLEWYRRTLGYLPAGEMVRHAPLPAGAPDVAALQGVPGADFAMSWAVDRREFFQLELFQYRHPVPRALPADWRLCDVGYGLVCFHVADFDAALARLAAAGTAALSAPLGEPGERRVCVRDPDGVLLELLERDLALPGAPPPARPQVPVGARGLTVSVPDLGRARRLFVEILGMQPRPELALHGPEHEALWGLAGARREALPLLSGDFLVELVEYADPPGRPRPAGHSISDHGILNIALGTRSLEDYEATRARVVAAGLQTDLEVRRSPRHACTYLLDEDGFSVELLFVDAEIDRELGFLPTAGRPPSPPR